MAKPPLLDTNILVYAVSNDERSERVQALLAAPFLVSVQALNEFANVAAKKLAFPISDIRQTVSDFCLLSRGIVPLSQPVHFAALDIAERYRLSFYDALMLAAARDAACPVCFSEDMQDGLDIDGVRIVNPFV